MSDLPTGKGGGPSPFVNAFDHPQLNSLRYNTSMAGSPLHLCYGTQRVTVNLLEFWGFSGSNGGAALRIWANGGVATGLGTVGLNGYAGVDGQSPDPVFASSDTTRR